MNEGIMQTFSRIFQLFLIGSLLLGLSFSAVAKPRRAHPITSQHKRAPKIVIKPGHHIKKIPRGAISILFGGKNLFFHAGFFYRWHLGKYIVVAAPIGITIPVLPAGCSAKVIAGNTYYVLHDTYFRGAPGGYVVASKPSPTEAVGLEPASVASQVSTVWIQNPNGSRTAVKITPSNEGQWIGPKGEYYTTFPTEAQLKPIYGLKGEVAAEAATQAPQRHVLWITNTNDSKTPIELERTDEGS